MADTKSKFRVNTMSIEEQNGDVDTVPSTADTQYSHLTQKLAQVMYWLFYYGILKQALCKTPMARGRGIP